MGIGDLALAVMLMLKYELLNGKTLVFMMERPMLSSSEMIITSTALLLSQQIFRRTVSSWMLASTVGMELPTPWVVLPLGPDACWLSVEAVLLALCLSSVLTFSSSCFTYWMVLPRIEILSV